MKNTLLFIHSFIFILFLSTANADNSFQNGALTIDERIPEAINLEFPDKIGTLEPKISEFKVLSSILMSNDYGERWATVTIKNRSSHQRLLDKKHIIAIFANGERRNPTQAKYKFSSREEVTIIINFGISKFPIFKINVKN